MGMPDSKYGQSRFVGEIDTPGQEGESYFLGC